MNLMPRPEKTITFDAFWSWIQDHPGCILRVGSADAVLFDDDDLHWVFMEEEDRRGVVQLIKGKNLVGELVLYGRNVHRVQVVPDPESGDRGHFLIELLDEGKEEPRVLYHFLVAHGIDQAVGHAELKH
jgi:hypothetical protein